MNGFSFPKAFVAGMGGTNSKCIDVAHGSIGSIECIGFILDILFIQDTDLLSNEFIRQRKKGVGARSKSRFEWQSN